MILFTLSAAESWLQNHRKPHFNQPNPKEERSGHQDLNRKNRS
ncbi:MAG: hypothetical protein ACKV1O_19710 [Saprospiraceae bacterium]